MGEAYVGGASDGLVFVRCYVHAVENLERIAIFDGNRVTAAGVSAGLDFALALAARLRGEDYARTAQLVAEYAPKPPFEAGSPTAAGPTITRRA